jgi:biopolymer transport protein ExbB/TolQ
VIDWYQFSGSVVASAVAVVVFYRWGRQRGHIDGMAEGFAKGRDIQRSIDEAEAKGAEAKAKEDCDRMVRFLRSRAQPRPRDSDRDTYRFPGMPDNSFGLTAEEMHMIQQWSRWRRR